MSLSYLSLRYQIKTKIYLIVGMSKLKDASKITQEKDHEALNNSSRLSSFSRTFAKNLQKEIEKEMKK